MKKVNPDSKELLPCPFCGAELKARGVSLLEVLHKDNCYLGSQTIFSKECDDKLEAWKTRTSPIPSADKGLVELDELVKIIGESNPAVFAIAREIQSKGYSKRPANNGK